MLIQLRLSCHHHLKQVKRVSLTVMLSETVLSIFNNLLTDSVMVEVSETLMLVGISKLYDSRVNTRSEYELRESFTVRLSLVLPLNSSVSANASLTVMDSDLLICDSKLSTLFSLTATIQIC
jgi:hypothetical protein